MRDFAQYFDGIFCLNLPSSTDRRQHIERLACGRDDCNNVLIPAQVATFVSFMNLWRHILEAQVETALIVEDDVLFADYAPRISEMIVEHRLLDQVGIRREDPMLLRLGWAAGPDHRTTGRVDFKPNHIKMSDPCYALNRAMAAKLLDSFERVDTTVDIFVHQRVGSKVANFTLFPPLAAELSWSHGAVESLIHPKPVRVSYLKKHHPERVQEIEATIQALWTHVKHVAYRPLLAIGHPRCGSGYMEQLLKAYGLDVGHERMGKDGISSWMFAVEDENPFALNPLAATRKNKHFRHVIHFVRDPRTAIPSIIRENRHSEKSYAFRRRHILKTYEIDLDDAGSEVEKALLSYIYWNKIIEEQKTDIVLRVEDAEDSTLRFLKAIDIVAKDRSIDSPPPKDVNRQKLYQGKLPERPDLSDEDWQSVSNLHKSEINEMCQRFGYPDLYGCC
jgi:GR25 family glycosyltransferase involved in LPS biosynthesis